MDYIYDQFGIKRKIKHLRAVEHLEELKTKHGANFWPVIEECFKIWHDTNPTEWKSYLIYLDEIKETRKVTGRLRGVTHDRQHDGYIRYTLDIPEKVMKMIRCIYDSEELPMDKKFFYEFGRRFPKLKIMEKV